MYIFKRLKNKSPTVLTGLHMESVYTKIPLLWHSVHIHSSVLSPSSVIYTLKVWSSLVFSTDILHNQLNTEVRPESWFPSTHHFFLLSWCIVIWFCLVSLLYTVLACRQHLALLGSDLQNPFYSLRGTSPLWQCTFGFFCPDFLKYNVAWILVMFFLLTIGDACDFVQWLF